MLLGSSTVRSGLPTSMRVAATWSSGRKQLNPSINAVMVDGQAVPFDIEGEAPALLSFLIPENAATSCELAIEVSAEGNTDLLRTTLNVYRVSDAAGNLEGRSRRLAKTKRAHRVDVQPSNGVLVMHMDNDVFIRVRDAQGRGVEGAEVEVRHETFPDGAYRRQTDSAGLAHIKLLARRPSFRLKLLINDGQRETEEEVLLTPLGRNMLFSSAPSGVVTETPVMLTLNTWRSDAELWCDLISEDVWLKTVAVKTKPGENVINFGSWPDGLYHAQCADHPFAIGESFATHRLEVMPTPSLAHLLESLEQASLRGAGPRVMPSRLEDATLSVDYWHAWSRPDPMEPELMMNTRPRIKADLETTYTERKDQLLVAMAVILGLVLIWVFETALRHSLDVRNKLREFADETAQGLMTDTSNFIPEVERQRQSLLKIQRVLAPSLVVATLVGNAVALIWLFAFIR